MALANLSIQNDARARFTAREREYVLSVAMKYVKNEDVAEDIAQEALMRAYLYRDSFRGDSQYSTWLYRIAATTSLMHLRKQRRTPVVAGDSDEDGELIADLADPAPTPEELSAATQELTRAARCLGALGEECGRIFMMRFVDGMTEPEIARDMDTTVAAVKSRAYRARNALRTARAA